MKLISWNVNGLRACVGKGFKDAFSKLDADFFCLQETKLQAGQIDIAFDGYESYWNYAEKKGYSGTAVFARRKPLRAWFAQARAGICGRRRPTSCGSRAAPDRPASWEYIRLQDKTPRFPT